MATARQNEHFAGTLLNTSGLLDEAIEWIKSNLEPDDVFDTHDLERWAKGQDPTDVCHESALLGWARGQLPADIFDDADLASWAEENGFSRD